MKFRIGTIIIFLLVLSSLSLQAQKLDISGHWEGVVSFNNEYLVLKIDFFKYNDTLLGACRLPEWEPDMLGTSPVKIEGEKVSFQLSGFGSVILKYDKRFDRLRGQSVNRNGVFDFQLGRVIQPAEKLYYNKTFDVPSTGGATLKAELIVPATQGPHPVVVFFHNRKEGSRHTQRGRALMLVRRGIAALIFDRRGEGSSTGALKDMLFSDLISDGMTIIDFLKTQNNIDPTQIGIYGYGTGAWVTPFIAVQNQDVAFVINVAGAAEGLWEQRWHAVEQSMKSSGVNFSDRDYQEAKAHMDLVDSFAKTRKNWPLVVKSIQNNNQKKWAEFADFPRNPNSDDFSWLFRFQCDPATSLKIIKQPLLAIFGEEDKIVPADVNAPKLKALLEAAGNPDYQITILPNAGHSLFIHSNEKGKDGKLVYRWRRISPEFNRTLLEWLDKHVRKSR